MPIFELSPGVEMFYDDHDFTDPWTPADTVLMLHGNAENGLAWNAWMPSFSRRFRVLRPDWRGFGRSTPMPVDHRWSFDEIVDDMVRFMDAMGTGRFHLVGNRMGGAIAMKFAANNPNRVRTLTVLGSPALGSETSVGHDPSLPERLRREGIMAWARETMPQRLGPSCAPEMFEGMVRLQARTPLTTQLGFLTNAPSLDLRDDLPNIACPALASDDSTNARGGLKTSTWHKLIPRSEFVSLPVDSRHPAVTHADRCAKLTLDFIDRGE